jgi:Putative Ice-binding-like adhesive domain
MNAQGHVGSLAATIALCAMAAAAPPVRAGFVCDELGPRLADFGVVTDKLVSNYGTSQVRGEPWGSSIYVGACTSKASLKPTVFGAYYAGPIALVATATDGVAVNFRRGLPLGQPDRSYVDGDIATGGGRVAGEFGPGDIEGTIDTTGTHPTVADCMQAMADAQTASAYFASLTPNRTFGATTIEPFETFTLAAAPNEVIHFDSLKVKGDFDPDFPQLCLESTVFRITGGPAVINVGSLDVGPCVSVRRPTPAVIFNVPGSGRQIRVGRGAVVQVPILAPGRNVSVRGTLDDQITFTGFVWARRLKMTGISSVEWPFDACG